MVMIVENCCEICVLNCLGSCVCGCVGGVDWMCGDGDVCEDDGDVIVCG